jgi:hypothetical protein
MTFTYIPGTPTGTVRLLCTDRDPDNEIFSDEEIAVFLDLNEQDVRLAAADALDQIAASQALILKYIEVNGLRTNGQAVANALHQQAESLRARAAAEAAEDDEYIDIIPGPGSIIAPDSWGMI